MIFTDWSSHGPQTPFTTLLAQRHSEDEGGQTKTFALEIRVNTAHSVAAIGNLTPGASFEGTLGITKVKVDLRPICTGDFKDAAAKLIELGGIDYFVNTYIRYVTRCAGVDGYNKHGHHVVPRCLGGTNCPENIAYLSKAQHRQAHIRLSAAFPYSEGLRDAVELLSVDKDGFVYFDQEKHTFLETLCRFVAPHLHADIVEKYLKKQIAEAKRLERQQNRKPKGAYD